MPEIYLIQRVVTHAITGTVKNPSVLAGRGFSNEGMFGLPWRKKLPDGTEIKIIHQPKGDPKYVRLSADTTEVVPSRFRAVITGPDRKINDHEIDLRYRATLAEQLKDIFDLAV